MGKDDDDSRLEIFEVGGAVDPSAVRAGTSTFDWWVKRISVAGLNDLQRKALEFACPGFGPGQRRRFAGDDTLPQGRYYTLLDHDGLFDGSTLVNELFAYHDPARSGIVDFVDHMDPAARAAYAARGIKVLPSHHITFFFPRTQSGPARIVRELGLNPEGYDVVVGVPYQVERMRIDNVIDLRLKTTQDWFVKYFGGRSHDQFLVRGFKAGSFKRLVEMLPVFYHETRGGSDFTAGFGAWMRRHGVNALTFPSARVNTQVEYLDGELKCFEGWNLVDFREAGATAAQVLIDLSPTYDMRVPEGFKIYYVDSGPHEGSWSIAGIEEAFAERLRLGRERAEKE